MQASCCHWTIICRRSMAVPRVTEWSRFISITKLTVRTAAKTQFHVSYRSLRHLSQAGWPCQISKYRQQPRRSLLLQKMPRFYSGNRKQVSFGGCQNIDEMLQLAADNLDGLAPSSTAAAWSIIARMMTTQRPQIHQFELASNDAQGAKYEKQISAILDHTANLVPWFTPKELATIILSMARTVRSIQEAQKRRTVDVHQLAFRKIFEDNNSNPKGSIFFALAEAADKKIHEFDSRCLSNFTYALALIRYNPNVNDKRSMLEVLAEASVDCIQQFKPQEIANTVWACATLKMPHPLLFQSVGDNLTRRDLNEFKPQELSNIVWAFASLKYQHHEMFKKIGDSFVRSNLKSYKPQNLVNTIWAYATLDVQHPDLFEKIGDTIVSLDDLSSFVPQDVSLTVWSYAIAKVQHPEMFNKIGDRIVSLINLKSFKSQALANTVWAYATLDIQHIKMFMKIGDSIVNMKNLNSFNPHELSNIVWSFATANVTHPKMFNRIGDTIVALDDLDSFTPHELSSTVWAYATANVTHPTMFKKIGDFIVSSNILRSFQHNELAKTVWAYATVNDCRYDLFQRVEGVIVQGNDLKSFNSQLLGNIAWSYAVANISAPLMFNEDFTKLLLDRQNEFTIDCLRRLHQWHLWQAREHSHTGLPEILRLRCQQEFDGDINLSRFQKDVVHVLISMGFNPKEEFLTDSGYRLDALVEINGNKIGIEADGPHHFTDEAPNGSTMLKRRQVTTIDKIPILSIPYWEWNRFGNDTMQKEQYLRVLLSRYVNQSFEQLDSLGKVGPENNSSSTLLAMTEEINLSPKQEAIDLESLTVPQLRKMLRSRGLKEWGRKAALIQRLTEINKS